MILWQWKILRWILLGGAFVSVLNTSGCSSANNFAVSRDASGVPIMASTAPTNIAMAADPSVLSAGSSPASDPVAPA